MVYLDFKVIVTSCSKMINIICYNYLFLKENNPSYHIIEIPCPCYLICFVRIYRHNYMCSKGDGLDFNH